jgi:hypothetical protein
VPVCCLYAVVKVRIDVPIVQSLVEQLVIDWGVRDMLVALSRRVVCWKNQWSDFMTENVNEKEKAMEDAHAAARVAKEQALRDAQRKVELEKLLKSGITDKGEVAAPPKLSPRAGGSVLQFKVDKEGNTIAFR